ncbi:MAG: hypothetical protein EZS28_019597 [Streblomastix strix]|uniref:Uncharacterized protein n=1 Tax=Streblomastix strix TaxID=222440 RepID=A0A5J4VQF3_9EUKA|nr:MAG: hypothetical protein EZS28_019597 [Streblomastix strix]
MRSDIISHLKSLTGEHDKLTQQNAMFALNMLARDPVNLSQIINRDELLQIKNLLQIELKGNEKQKKEIIKQQENKCEFITGILRSRFDEQTRQEIIKIGIANILLNIFATRDFQTITLPFSTGFGVLCTSCSQELIQLIINMNPYPQHFRLLDHSNQDIVRNASDLIHNFLCIGVNRTLDRGMVYEGSGPHPDYDLVVSCGGVQKIFDVFRKINNLEIKKGGFKIPEWKQGEEFSDFDGKEFN